MLILILDWNFVLGVWGRDYMIFFFLHGYLHHVRSVGVDICSVVASSSPRMVLCLLPLWIFCRVNQLHRLFLVFLMRMYISAGVVF